MRVLFGDISLGVQEGVMTGPTQDGWSKANTWAEHKPARGVPQLQEIGRELERRELAFFFSEEFCDVASELSRLERAHASKSAGALVPLSGPYGGKRYVVDKLRITVKKTTPDGQPVRVEGKLALIESTSTGSTLLSTARSLAAAAAPALALKGGVNIGAQR